MPFELALVDRAKQAHKTPACLELNPNGLIPVLVEPRRDRKFSRPQQGPVEADGLGRGGVKCQGLVQALSRWLGSASP